MILRYFYDEQLSQASYLVGCPESCEALVVDPNRDVEQYIELAERRELRITHVTETHIHADFVSGARELAARTGAHLLLSGAGPEEWRYAYASDAGATLLCDGDRFDVGSVRVDVLHTPGHTPEHLCFVVTDTASADEPMGVFTGDCVFVGDVGRPDLLETTAGVAGAMAEGARHLYGSLARFRALPAYAQVWPGHGAGSACGRALGAVPQSTVGYERRFNWAFREQPEEEFVRAVLEGQPDPPPYFARMKRVNRDGPRPLAELRFPPRLPAERLAPELDDGLLVVDLRAADQYAAGHAPGTLNIPLGSGFVTWAGWLLPYDRAFALLVEEGAVGEAVRLLRLIGQDEPAGYWTPEALDAWASGGRTPERTERVDAARLGELVLRGEVEVLDVRNPGELATGRIAGSRNIPLGQLARRLGEVPADRPVVVHCQAGLRSAVAASLLQAHGRPDVLDLEGGFGAWEAAGQPVERPAAEGVAAGAGAGSP